MGCGVVVSVSSTGNSADKMVHQSLFKSTQSAGSFWQIHESLNVGFPRVLQVHQRLSCEPGKHPTSLELEE